MEYFIVGERSFSRLEESVTKMIKQGWKPLGGAFSANPFSEECGCKVQGVYQTMIREEKKD